MTTRKKAAPPEPLKAYDAQGQVTAFSYDGGKRWTPNYSLKPEVSDDGPAFSRKIAALAPEGDVPPPWFERRIATSFAPLGDAGILAGWGQRAHIKELKDESLDAIVVPYDVVADLDLDEVIAELRRVAPLLLLDTRVENFATREDIQAVTGVMSKFNAVITPSDMLSISCRKFNANIFTVPTTLNPIHWHGVGREARNPNDPIRVALQPSTDPWAEQSLRFVAEKFSGKVEIIEDDWSARSIQDEPLFYTEIDVVVAGSPGSKILQVNTQILAPMMAGCCVVADVSFTRAILHQHSGLIVAGRGPSPWRKVLTNTLTDARFRGKMQRGARERSRLFVNRTMLNQLAMPYRALIKR